MNIMDNVKSVLIIDNKYEEVEGLISVLDSECIYHRFYTPDDVNDEQKKMKNHQIIFMDFSLDDSKKDVENIALIRNTLKKICNEKFGTYGLVLWTRHIEYITEFKRKLSIDAKNKKYITPLFVIGLDKTLYLQNGYNDLWCDLSNKLHKDKAATFFFNWRNSVETSADSALNNMYQLVPNYEDQHKQFQYLLYKMAGSYSGVPTKRMEVYEGMYKDAYRAFDELLYSDLIAKQSGLSDIFPEKVEEYGYTFEEEMMQISKINSKFLLDLSITNQDIVMPGNVYKIVKENKLLQIKGAPQKQKHNYVPIAIEMTPPCDFSHKKVSSRLIGGFMVDCPMERDKLNQYVNKTFKADSKYLIWPIDYDGNMKFMCFDFRNIYIETDEAVKDASSYKLLFMVKHRLFADILQKFSSHAARLGISIVQPDIKI